MAKKRSGAGADVPKTSVTPIVEDLGDAIDRLKEVGPRSTYLNLKVKLLKGALVLVKKACGPHIIIHLPPEKR